MLTQLLNGSKQAGRMRMGNDIIIKLGNLGSADVYYLFNLYFSIAETEKHKDLTPLI